MSNPSGFDFTKFVPGFDFLKSLTPGGSSGTAAAAPAWVAPTLDPEELDKRIHELKTVHFWLEQNTKAVAATIQAMEVQRMTLATLKRMNMSFNDLAESLKVKPESEPEAAAAPAPEPKADAAAPSGIDPAHWWGALTDQFQHIAQNAMKEMANNATAHPGADVQAAGQAGAATRAKKPARQTKGRAGASKGTAKTTRKTVTKPRAASRRAV